MKKMTFTLLLLLLALGASAQDMKQLWIAMPDEFLPYLDSPRRKEMVDYIELGVKADVGTLVNSTAVLDTISSDYLKATISEAKTIELLRLPLASAKQSGDTIVCMLTTISMPEKMCRIEFFDPSWKQLPTESHIDAPYSIGRCLNRPESMSQERYSELCSYFELEIMTMQLHPGSRELSIQPSLPLLSEEDRESVREIIVQRNLKWNGEIFK